MGIRFDQPGLDLGAERGLGQRPDRGEIFFYRHDQAARAQHRGLPPQQRGRVRNRPQDQPLDDRIERPARHRVVEVALREPYLRQAALPGPQPGAGQRLRRAVDADHQALGTRQAGGRERHVPGSAA